MIFNAKETVQLAECCTKSGPSASHDKNGQQMNSTTVKCKIGGFKDVTQHDDQRRKGILWWWIIKTRTPTPNIELFDKAATIPRLAQNIVRYAEQTRKESHPPFPATRPKYARVSDVDADTSHPQNQRFKTPFKFLARQRGRSKSWWSHLGQHYKIDWTFTLFTCALGLIDYSTPPDLVINIIWSFYKMKTKMQPERQRKST